MHVLFNFQPSITLQPCGRACNCMPLMRMVRIYYFYSLSMLRTGSRGGDMRDSRSCLCDTGPAEKKKEEKRLEERNLFPAMLQKHDREGNMCYSPFPQTVNLHLHLHLFLFDLIS